MLPSAPGFSHVVSLQFHMYGIPIVIFKLSSFKRELVVSL